MKTISFILNLLILWTTVLAVSLYVVWWWEKRKC